jgi:phosphoenolpyruvate carboxykinase (GTP)
MTSCGWVDPEVGRLRAINPEAGYFGVVPGTNTETNPNAMALMSHNTIYTNVLLPDGDVWWEGKPPAAEGMHRLDRAWTPEIAGQWSKKRIPTADSPPIDEQSRAPIRPE